MAERPAAGQWHADVVGEDRLLESLHIGSDAAHRVEKLPADLAVGRSEGLWRHKQAVAGDSDTIDPARVVEDGVEPLGSDVGTDPFHDLLRRERLTEDVDGLLPSGGADHVPLGDEFSAQRFETGPPPGERQINPGTGGGARHGWWSEGGAVAGQSLNLTRPPAPPQVRGWRRPSLARRRARASDWRSNFRPVPPASRSNRRRSG